MSRLGIILPDIHTPLHDEPAIRCVLKAIKRVKPDFAVFLGDLGEWESVSAWQWKKRKRPPLDYQLEDVDEDIESVNRFLDRFDRAFATAGTTEKHFCQGNHDKWLDNFVDEYPHLARQGYRFERAMDLKTRGYRYYPAGRFCKICKLHFYHGHNYGGVMHTRNHLLKLGGNVMYAHYHDFQTYSMARLGGTIAAWCIGCLKNCSDEANLWLGGRKHNWVHMFALVHMEDNGNFAVEPVPIINGAMNLWGREYNGT